MQVFLTSKISFHFPSSAMRAVGKIGFFLFAKLTVFNFHEKLEHLKWRKGHRQIIPRSIKFLPLHRRPHGLRRQHAAHGVREAKCPQPPALEDVTRERRQIVGPRPSRRLAGADGAVEPRQKLCRSSIDALVDRPAHAAAPLAQCPAPGPRVRNCSTVRRRRAAPLPRPREILPEDQ